MATGIVRAAAYYRMSDARQEASIDRQKAEVRAYASRLGYDLVREYQDEAISGDESRRPGFRKLIDDATGEGGFEAILCFDQDRLSRFDPLEANYYWYQLRQAGVWIETVAQGRLSFEDLAGWLQASIIQYAKNAYLKDLSRNVLSGQAKSAAMGYWPGGHAPHGYRVQPVEGTGRRNPPKKLVVEPTTRPIVERIFRDYVENDTGLSGIAWRLNDEGIPSPRGKRWRPAAVAFILRDAVYTGLFEWPKVRYGKHNHIDVDGSIIQGKANGKLGPVIRIPNNHPPIIDQATFDRAQRKLNQNRTNTSPSQVPYALSGLMRCNHCGSKMVGAVYRGVRSYICSGYHAQGKSVCQRNSLREALLVDVLVRKLQLEYLAPPRLEELAESIRQMLQVHGKADRRDTERIKAQIQRLDWKIEQGTENALLAEGKTAQRMLAKLAEWERERDQLREQLEHDRRHDWATVENAEQTIQRSIETLQNLHEQLQDADPTQLQAVFRAMVHRIDLNFTWTQQGKRRIRRFSHGKVHVRPNALSDLSSTTGVRNRCAARVKRSLVVQRRPKADSQRG